MSLLLLLLLVGCQGRSTLDIPDEKSALPVAEKRLGPHDYATPTTLLAHTSTHVPYQENALWRKICERMTLPFPKHDPEVLKYIQQYAKYPYHVRLLSERAAPYLHMIYEEVSARGMPGELALLPMVESSFNPSAVSEWEAAGLWQIRPATGERFGLTQRDDWFDARLDVVQSTQAALDYLEHLHRRVFAGNWVLSVAAYNSGEGRVRKVMRQHQQKGHAAEYWNMSDLPPQTRAYLPKLLALSHIIAHPEHYGVELAKIPDTPYFQRIELPVQVDLDYVAKLCDMTAEQFNRLNTGYLKWATHPLGPHHVYVPVHKVLAVQAHFSNLDLKSVSLTTKEYVICRGDSLSSIARRFHTTVADLRLINGITKEVIIVGHRIRVPIPADVVCASDSIRAIHQIQKGESLSKIAKQHQISVEKLMQENHLKNALIHPGQKLVIF